MDQETVIAEVLFRLADGRLIPIGNAQLTGNLEVQGNMNVITIGGLRSILCAGMSPYTIINLDTEFGLLISHAGGVLGKFGFHDATPTPQRASAAQAAVTATVGADLGAFDDPPTAGQMAALRTFVNALKVDAAALIVLANEIRAALIPAAGGLGLIKGSA